MRDAPVVALNGRAETGELLMLFQATLDEPDAGGRLVPERYTVTAKVLRSREGQIVASARITAPDEADLPTWQRSDLHAAAQRLADWIIAHIRSLLSGETTDTLDACRVAANLETR